MYDIDYIDEQEGMLAAALKGAAAGLVGRAALTLGMQYAPQLLQRAGLMPQQDGQQQQETPAEKLAETVAENTLNTSLDPDTKAAAGQLIHWSYGAAWGAFYGIAQNEMRMPHLLHGAVLGGIVATVGSTAVPAMGLSPSPTEQPVQVSAMQMGLHLLYGEVTALVYQALDDI